MYSIDMHIIHMFNPVLHRIQACKKKQWNHVSINTLSKLRFTEMLNNLIPKQLGLCQKVHAHYC